MTVAASGLILGFLLATAYGAGFHFLVGGPARRIIIYLVAAWIGFAIGHFVGDLINLNWLRLGALQLFSASVGSWVALILSWWLAGDTAVRE
ncbi:MAG: hypothetical protein H6654_01850 [Ardenticatenaceae bacterium]|nr:hypothetical protein [Anaerolineales bacterium]MCB8940929.1 hypothetical protein [Ardenticatenaceae bacterium]MCB8972268.1 hypothetical protein [Ardenticatenaceae bacterium]